MHPKSPVGKGIFIWQLPACAGGNAQTLALITKEAGFSWVSIKVQQSIGEYTLNKPLMYQALQELENKGISRWGWGYVTGANTLGVNHAAKEAAMTIQLIQQYELEGFMIDAEAEYKRPNATLWANTYMHALRAGLPDIPIGLCSYRYPSVHPQLPWTAFLEHCDFHNPQVYWEGAHNPGFQLEKSVSELLSLKNLPVVPIGSAYARGTWAATADDLDEFDGKAHELELPGVSWWSFQHAEQRAEWWDTIAAHAWPVEPPPLTWEQSIDAWARTMGYDGPPPPVQ